MINPQESAQEIKSYLYKLSSVIERKSALPFSKVKYIEKVLLDDILCCIEASFSSEYKRFVKTSRSGRIKSYDFYEKLVKSIRNKPLFSVSTYAVKYVAAKACITQILNSIDMDMRIVYNEQ